MTGLADPYLKLSWAKHHLDTLDLELESFYQSEPYRFTRKDDLENQRHFLRVDLMDVPDRMSLIVGDAFYCMRSSLDQLVWRLAKLTVVTPGHTQFPIIEKWNSESRHRFKAQLSGVPDEAIAIIRDLQPANGPEPCESYLLWRLDTMCKLDKHRRILANGSDITFHLPTGDSTVTIEALDDCGIISVPLADKRKLDLHPSTSFTVNFGDFTARVGMNVGGIGDIHKFIMDSVLPRFMRFFA